MTRERIEDFKNIILPFFTNYLLKENYEGLGKSDAEEFEKDFSEILNLAAKALEQKSCEDARWVPVSEEYPTKNGRYLVTVKQGYITFGAWVDVAENWAQVTAWMPLPEPFESQESEEIGKC